MTILCVFVYATLQFPEPYRSPFINNENPSTDDENPSNKKHIIVHTAAWYCTKCRAPFWTSPSYYKTQGYSTLHHQT